MNPGLYPNISDDDYHSGPGISNSGLRIIGEYSPAHYLAQRLIPREETPALVTGKRIHRAVLEPEKFATQFAVAPKWDMRTTVGKLASAEWAAENEGRTPITQDEYDRYSHIRDSVYRDADALRLLTTGHAERSVYAKDPVTGVLVKCRPDFDSNTYERVLVDLKSTGDARPDAFSRSAFDYGYYQQAAFYLDVCEWAGAGHRPDRFVFIAVEKDPPYAVRVYEASQNMIRRGRDAYRAALDTYAECLDTDTWPGYPSGTVQLDIPAWAEKRLDADQNDEIQGISYVE